MIDTLQNVLTKSSARDTAAVEASLVKQSDVAIPWFD